VSAEGDLMRRFALFEDSLAGNLRPLSWLRPVFELRCGHFTLRERLQVFSPEAAWGAFVRPELAETYREDQPLARVNDERWLAEGPTWLIHGRWLPDPAALKQLEGATAAVCDGVIVVALIDPDEAALVQADTDWTALLSKLCRNRQPVEVGGRLIDYPWDLVEANPEQLARDFVARRRGASKANLSAQVAIQGNDHDVFIDPTAQIDPFVVIDARSGPVWIEGGVHLQPFTRLEGPCFVGQKSQVFRASVRGGTSIGPVCRIGGEIEASVIHSYANKYHDGFLGHSYVCPWVNLGALSTNSDLKNDYSTVRVPLWGEPLDTGSAKVGCFIADHAKAALSSLFNTGTSVGVMSMILPAGELLPKHLPSFSRLWHGDIEELTDLDGAFETARIAMSRRGCTLTPAAVRLLKTVFEQTADERALAMERSASKKVSS
jgi:UDP-N-acetylglucosamine diphosphorylase/glucosamine-1-phosphate N-acetyltransferase